MKVRTVSKKDEAPMYDAATLKTGLWVNDRGDLHVPVEFTNSESDVSIMLVRIWPTNRMLGEGGGRYINSTGLGWSNIEAMWHVLKPVMDKVIPKEDYELVIRLGEGETATWEEED